MASDQRIDGDFGDHADDYSWVVGRLAFAEFEGGFWVLEFGDSGAPHGGQLVLGTPDALRDLESGTLVRLEGHIANDQFGFQMAGTRYDVVAARPVNA